MKRKHIFGVFTLLIIITLQTMSVQVKLACGQSPAEAALSNVRFDDKGNYGIVAGGVGLTGTTSGDIQLNVQGEVIAAYLYWAGIGTETTGDNTVELNGVGVTVLDTYGPVEWYLDGRHYVYVAEVTEQISSGDNTYTISQLDMPEKNYGAGIVVIYQDDALPMVRIALLEGLDGFWFDWASPLGPNSEVFCFDFDPSTVERDANMLLIAGGTEHDDRPNEIYTQTGSGAKPANLVTGGAVDGDYPLEASDGSSWDTYSQNVTISPGDEWLCTQVESIDNYEVPKDEEPLYGRGTSALLIATALKIPIKLD